MSATPAQRAKLKRRIETAPLMPSEHEEQAALFAWAAVRRKQYPELTLLFAIPNMGKRHVSFAVKMRDEGLKKGVPDIFLPVARRGYHGCFIELKRRKGGVVSEEQQEWIDELTANGYLAVVCRGAETAIKTIEDYLR